MIPALLFPLRVSSMVRSDRSDNDSSFQKEPLLPPFFPVTINDLSPFAHGCQMRRGEERRGQERKKSRAHVSEFCIQLNDNTGNCNKLIFSAHRGLGPTRLRLLHRCTYPGRHPSVRTEGAPARSCRSGCCGWFLF